MTASLTNAEPFLYDSAAITVTLAPEQHRLSAGLDRRGAYSMSEAGGEIMVTKTS